MCFKFVRVITSQEKTRVLDLLFIYALSCIFSTLKLFEYIQFFNKIWCKQKRQPINLDGVHRGPNSQSLLRSQSRK